MAPTRYPLDLRTGRHLARTAASRPVKAGQVLRIAAASDGAELHLQRTGGGFELVAGLPPKDWPDAFGVMPYRASRVALGEVSWPAAQARAAAIA